MNPPPSKEPAADTGAMIKAAAGAWTGLAAIGSFMLYVAGYLALRFHLAVFGIATDLSVLDERYLFSGARFLVYVVSTLPTLLMVGVVAAGLAWLASRAVPRPLRGRLGHMALSPGAAVLLGIAVSMVAIQGFMKQAYFLVDLLLAPQLPSEPAWLVALLMGTSKITVKVYFDLLVASCLLPIAILVWLFKRANLPKSVAFGRFILGLLLSIQLLLLPINFGTLIADMTLARVVAAGSRASLPGETIWLAWEGSTGMTFLIANAHTNRRSLLTQPRDKVGLIEIVGSNVIIPTLFKPNGEPRPVPNLENP